MNMNFNRGKMFIESQLSDMNTELEVIDPYHLKPQINPNLMLARVSLKNAGLNLAKRLFHFGYASDTTFDFKMVLDLIFRKPGDLFRTLFELAPEPRWER